MGKFLKVVLGSVVVLFIVVALVLVFVVSNLDRLVKGAIETVGSDVTGVPVSVASVQISLQKGEGIINGLRVGNPAGFDSDYAIKLNRAAVDLDLEAISAELIVLELVAVDGAQLNYEQKGRDSNLQTIMNHLEAYTGDTAKDQAPEAGGGVKVIIDQFDFLNAAATVSLPALKQSREVDIPDVRLVGIGRRSSGVTAAEAAKQILRPIIEQSITAAVGVSVDEAKEEAIERAKEKATKKLGDFLKRD